VSISSEHTIRTADYQGKVEAIQAPTPTQCNAPEGEEWSRLCKQDKPFVWQACPENTRNTMSALE
jgi:hypothetical protein